MAPLKVTEAARNFAEYINRVAYRGERFILMRGGKGVAELRPLATGRRLGELPALIASLPRLSEAAASAFAADIDASRNETAAATLRDPWES